jgi:hypothetical protein
MPNEAQLPVATLVVRQSDLTAVNALGEIQQRSGGRTTSAEDEWALRGESALSRDLIIRDDGRRDESECPVDLGPAVMESAVMAIDHEGDSLSTDPELTVQEAEAGPGTPETDDIGRSHEQDLVGDLQGGTMGSLFPTQEVGADIQNDESVALAKLADQPLDESRGDSRPKLELRRAADDRTVCTISIERLDLLRDGVGPLVRALGLCVSQHVQVTGRVGVDLRRRARAGEIDVNQHGRRDQAQTGCQVQRDGRPARTPGAARDRDDGQGR